MKDKMTKILLEELKLIIASSIIILLLLADAFLLGKSSVKEHSESLPENSLVRTYNQECSKYINDIMKFEDHANSIENDIERAYYYQSIANEINKKLEKLDMKYLDFSDKYKRYIFDLEKKLNLKHYNFIDSRPHDIPFYKKINVANSVLKDNVQYKHAVALKGRYIRLYSYYSKLIENYSVYVSLLHDFENHKDIVLDLTLREIILKKKIEEFHYSDSMDVVKGIPTYIDDSYSFMSVQRNERGGIESIEWVKK